MMNYKTSFKKQKAYSFDKDSLCEVSEMKVYRTKTGFKCTITGLLNAEIEPWTEKGYYIAKKLTKKFPGIIICSNGSVHIEATSFSKCHPDDTFVDKKGQRIAESRCKTKIFKKSQKIIKCLLDIKQKELNNLLDAIKDYQKLIDTEDNHIKVVETWNEK